MGTINLLRKASLFSGLSEEDAAIIAEYSELRRCPKGTVVFTEGSAGEELYVVASGEVLVTREGQDGRPFVLASFVEGGFFGELDLLEEIPHSATATCEQESELLVFPRKGTRFSDLLRIHPAPCARLLHRLLATVAGRIRETNRLISQNAPWVRELRRQIQADSLTGLFNRAYLEEELPRLLARPGARAAVLVIKPDNFKQVNDCYGHHAGDGTLQLLAGTVRAGLPEGALAVRYRGDEFVVVLPDAGSEQASELGKRLIAAVSGIDLTGLTGGMSHILTASAGVTEYPEDTRTAEEAILKAFERMHAVREQGGNDVYRTAD